MPATLLALLALAVAQPAPEDGPLPTAPKEVAARDAPGLDDQAVEPPPAGAKPVDETKTAPAAVASAKALTVEQKTLVEGGPQQVVLGARALLRQDDKGLPVLAKVEEGKLADAHLPGAVTETFEPPPEGLLAVALDGSAEARATVLKVWNQTGKAVSYDAIALIMRQGKVVPAPAPVCDVAPGAVRTEKWPRPVVAVGLQRFRSAAAAKPCNAASSG